LSRDILVAVADTHVNSTCALCPPVVHLDDGGEYHPSRAQAWLWQCWNDLLEKVKAMRRPGDRLYGLLDGDGPDANPRTSQLIAENEETIVATTIETIRPLREMCDAGFWVLRGTEAHGGDAGNLEEAVARGLQATKYPADGEAWSCWFLKLRLQGLVIDVAHHGRMGMLPWTKANALGGVAYEMLDLYVRNGEPPPALCLRAHRHRSGDTFENYPVRVVALPAWQLATAYSHKVATRKPSDIGGAIITIQDGRLGLETVLFRPKADAVWEPDPAALKAAQKPGAESNSRSASSSRRSSKRRQTASKVDQPEP
jgi:hypothetical protein